MKPEGWKCCTDEIYTFFDSILHSLIVNKNKFEDDNSDDGRGHNGNWGFAQPNGLVDDEEENVDYDEQE